MTTIYSVLDPMIGEYKDAETIEEATTIMVDIMIEFIPDTYADILLSRNPTSNKANVMYDYFMMHTHNSPIAMIQLNADGSKTWLDFKMSEVKELVLSFVKVALGNQR